MQHLPLERDLDIVMVNVISLWVCSAALKSVEAPSVAWVVSCGSLWHSKFFFTGKISVVDLPTGRPTAGQWASGSEGSVAGAAW